MSNYETPGMPDDPFIPDDIVELIIDIKDRDVQRKRAIDIARQKADEATNDTDREFYVGLAASMSDARIEFHELYPETFPDDTQ